MLGDLDGKGTKSKIDEFRLPNAQVTSCTL